MTPARPRTVARLATAALAALVLPLGGCRVITGQTSGAFVSNGQPHRLTPDLSTKVFKAESANTADFVLSDLPPETLTDGEAWRDAVGQVIHARMFVRPRPGRTPIETTACTVTLRYIVLAGEGQYGIYAGGGFMIPSGDPDDSSYGGSIYNATLRLVSATPGFHDLIGSGELGLSFRAERDEDGVVSATRNADFLAFAAQPVRGHPLLVQEE